MSAARLEPVLPCPRSIAAAMPLADRVRAIDPLFAFFSTKPELLIRQILIRDGFALCVAREGETQSRVLILHSNRDYPTVVAALFARKLLDQLGPETMRKVVRKNTRREVAAVCHSHDFCDANMVMHEAMTEFIGRAPDMNNDRDCTLWNEAWAIAKANGFYLANQ